MPSTTTPPDPNFSRCTPRLSCGCPHARHDGRSPANATAINRCYDAVDHQAGLHRALLTAIERAQGAAIARIRGTAPSITGFRRARSSLANDSNKFIAISAPPVPASSDRVTQRHQGRRRPRRRWLASPGRRLRPATLAQFARTTRPRSAPAGGRLDGLATVPRPSPIQTP